MVGGMLCSGIRFAKHYNLLFTDKTVALFLTFKANVAPFSIAGLLLTIFSCLC
jgi:hypothetical protein